MDFLLELPECTALLTLNFGPVKPISDFGPPNCEIWNLCCFSPLHLWYSVTAVSQSTTTILLLQRCKRHSFLPDRNQHVRNAIEGTCTPVKSCLSLCDPKDYSSPGKNAGVGCHALFQGIYPTQGSNLSLTSPALVGGFFNTCVTWEAWRYVGESI